MRFLRFFTWVSWGYLPCTDISCRTEFCRFLPFFLCFYLWSKWNIYFFILVFFRSYSFQSLSFPVLYFPCLLLSIFLLCLSFYVLYSLFLRLSLSLSVVYFLSCCLLSFSSDFIYLSSSFSFCFYVFLCLLLSFLAFFYFHSLSVFFYIPITLLLIFLCSFIIILFIQTMQILELFHFYAVSLTRLAWLKLSNNIEDSQQQFEKKTFVSIKN